MTLKNFRPVPPLSISTKCHILYSHLDIKDALVAETSGNMPCLEGTNIFSAFYVLQFSPAVIIENEDLIVKTFRT